VSQSHCYPPVNRKFPFIFHGADYSPDQWPKETWLEDIRLMKAANINIATLPVFSWTNLQPDEETFTFEWLDEILELLAKNNICVALATPTASEPAWMAQKYPEVLRADKSGRRNRHGERNNNCPNSTIYRKFSANIARKLSQRYHELNNIALWHISNEYSLICYCENCAQTFRVWLQGKYQSLDHLNERWYTSFWSHNFTDWSQIDPPFENGEKLMQALSLDYTRFMNESLLACYLK